MQVSGLSDLSGLSAAGRTATLPPSLLVLSDLSDLSDLSVLSDFDPESELDPEPDESPAAGSLRLEPEPFEPLARAAARESVL